MYEKYRQSLFELFLVLAGALVVFILSGWLDLAEKIVKHIDTFEKYELDELLCVFFYLVVAFFILAVRRLWVMKELVNEIRRQNEELTDYSSEIKTLKKLLPICMYCKKIRTGTDDWERLEAYITKRTDSRFSHGICPECAEIHFSKEMADLKKEK